jgi:hypothetical protein
MTPMKGLAAWWDLIERACGSVFEPRIDVSASDREIEALLRASWIGSIGESLASTLHAAWLDSRCRSLLRAALNPRS